MTQIRSHVIGVEVIVVIIVSDPTVLSQVLICPTTQLVEDVEISLPRVLADHSGFLQQEIGYFSPSGLAGVEEDFNIFPESGGVVVSDSLGIPEGLQQRIGGLDDILHVAGPVAAARDLGDVVHDELCGDRLAGPALAGDDDALVLQVGGETAVHVVCQGVDVRRVLVGGLTIYGVDINPQYLISTLAYRSLVHVNLLVSEVRHCFERVDRDEDRADVRKDPIFQESLLEVLMNVRLRDLSK